MNCGSEAGLDDIPDGAQITVDGWVRSLSKGENDLGVIIQKDGNSGLVRGWCFRMGTGIRGLEGLVNCATGAYARSGLSAFDPSEGAWHHVLMTYDENGADTPVARRIYLAIGGVWVAAYHSQQDSVGAYISDANDDVLIGNAPDLARTFDGDIGWTRVSDNVRFAVNVNFAPPKRCILPLIDANTLGQWIGYEKTGVTIDNQEGTAARDGTQTDCVFACDC